MRRLVGVSLVTLAGCLLQNPAYKDDNGISATGTASGSAGATEGPPTTGEATGAPTSGEGLVSASGTGGEVTSEATVGEVTTDAVTSEAGTSASSGEATAGSSTTGPVQPVCLNRFELGQYPTTEDTGVVPSTMGSPCPWQGGVQDCATLNFGTTWFYRLVHDANAGRNAALFRFETESLVEDLDEEGLVVEDIVGLRFAVVVWENKAAPDGVITLDIDLVAAEDQGWLVGTKDAGTATDGDSSFACRRRENGQCTPWADAGGPLAVATKLGELSFDAVEIDEDQSPTEYHARVESESLPAGPLVEQLLGGVEPTLALSLQTMRGLAEPQIGIKLREAEWTDPTLVIEVCSEWSE